MIARRSRLARCATVAAIAAIAGCSGSTTAQPTTLSSSAPPTTSASEPTLIVHDEWGDVFDAADVVGTFVLREVGSQETHVWNVERAEQRRRPASTFKILNSMIILQTGVLPDVDAIVPWDGVSRDVAEWNRDHSLRSGIAVSAVWMYQQLAREVGEIRMADWVARTGYGNVDIDGGIDEFWLNGDLEISPAGQLDFLERTVTGDLPFDDEVIDGVREILIREQGDDWTWSHKTGTALIEDPPLGWLVGTTSYEGSEWVFAMNIDLPTGLDGSGIDGQIDPQLRQTIAREILESHGALPASP